ncbi:MAG: mechanosensitive ion channel family protein [Geminicoccaceae bacterium]
MPHAQAQDTAAPADDTAPPPAAGTTGVDLATLIRSIEDPDAREDLLAKLRTLRDAQSGTAAQLPAETDDASALDDVVEAIETRIGTLSDVMLASIRSVMHVPTFLSWAVSELSNPERRAFLLDIGEKVLIVIAAGVAAAISAQFLIRRYRARLSLTGNLAPLRAAGVIGARLALELVPLGLFIALTRIVLPLVPMSFEARLVGRNVIWAIGLWGLIAVLRRALLFPLDGPGRLLAVSDQTARDLSRAVGVIGAIAIFGHFALSIGLLLDMPWEIYGVLQHLLFLIVTALTIISILQFAERGCRHLGKLAAKRRHSTLVRVFYLHRIAQYWHVLAIAWVLVLFIAWALHVPGGFERLLFASVGTVVIAVVSRLLIAALVPPPNVPAAPVGSDAEPADDEAATVNAPPKVQGVRALLALAIKLVTALALLLVWYPDVIAWLSTPGGEVVTAKVVRIAIVAGIALAIWEMANAWIQNYLTAVDDDGNTRHSRRGRTLVTIGRNVLLVVILLFTALIVLGELGINTAPLLAGAGVVGIALGFGSQKLVQDIITGAFILVGDTIRVGDVVDVGGRSGAVEALSMRTVTLRGYNGNVITIPYSTIDVVTNMTKDFSYAAFDVSVGYKEDPDQVATILREIDQQLRREWPYRRLMLEPIEIAGLDRFADSALVIKARIKTRAGEQWRVAREFNRRIKLRFDELGIEIPYPYQTIVLGDKGGDLRRTLGAGEAADDTPGRPDRNRAV